MKMFFLSSDSVRNINNTNTSSQKPANKPANNPATKPANKPIYRRRGMLPMFNINSIITTSYASSCNSCSG